VFSKPAGANHGCFYNQGKNALQHFGFSIEIFLFKIEIACGKKLKGVSQQALRYKRYFGIVCHLYLLANHS
jgi:hypothetical protein